MESYYKISTDDMNEEMAVLDMVYVAPYERGKGIAMVLVAEAIEEAKRKGYKGIGLYAYGQEDGIDTDRLVEFYKKCGFNSLECVEDMELIF